MNCNNSFSKAMALNVINDSVLFLVCTPGNSVDISGYLNGEKDNVCLDYRNKFNELNIVDHCTIIKFKLKKIDIIIQIDVNNVERLIHSKFPFLQP